MEHSNELLEPRLKPQDLKNMEVVGQVSGFDLWPNQKDGEPLWVFVTPGTKETATLLKRIDNMPKIEGKKIRPIIIPVAMSESGIRSTIQTICVDGKTDPVTTVPNARSEEHTSELQSLMRISYAVFSLKKNNKTQN